MTIRENENGEIPDKFALGILLVHGIGVKQPGQTLVHWSDALLKIIEEGTKKTVNDGTRKQKNSLALNIEEAVVAADPQSNHRPEAVVHISHGHDTTRWLICEASWGNAFPAPRYGELISWSVRALPWALVTQIAEKYWQLSEEASTWEKLRGFIKAVLSLIFAIFISPFLISILAITSILGLVPISGVRTFVLALQSTLTATAGDSFAYAESRLRAALIRTRVVDGLKQLKSRCRRTVIIAHSQGAAVVFDALGGTPDYNGRGTSDGERPNQLDGPFSFLPDTLVTFGAGTKKLANLIPLAKQFGLNPALIGVFSMLAQLGSIVWLFYLLPQYSFCDILTTLIFFLVGIVLIAELVWVNPLTEEQLTHRKWWVKIAIVPVVLWIALLLWAFYSGLHGNVLRFHAGIFSATTVFFLSWLYGMLFPHKKSLWRTRVHPPPGLRRWVDLYASADPVPNGQTRLVPNDGPIKFESKQIWYQHSLLGDHTSYWENRDGFVLRVARICAETAESPWVKVLPSETDDVDEQAKWRASYLRIARYGAVVSWALLGISILRGTQLGLGMSLQRMYDGLQSWIPFLPRQDTWTVPAFPMAFITLAVWGVYRSQLAIWKRWSFTAQNAVLVGEERVKDEPVPVGGFIEWTTALMVMIVVGLIWGPIGTSSFNLDSVFVIIFVTLILSVTLILRYWAGCAES